MKWSEEKINQLKELAQSGTPNKEIARQLNISITDVYAKRSQLGITIDKVKATEDYASMQINPVFEKAAQDMDTKVSTDRKFNAKQDLIYLLEPVIKAADNSVKGLKLSSDSDFVTIMYNNGGQKRACIECDGLLAIIADVTHKCLY